MLRQRGVQTVAHGPFSGPRGNLGKGTEQVRVLGPAWSFPGGLAALLNDFKNPHLAGNVSEKHRSCAPPPGGGLGLQKYSLPAFILFDFSTAKPYVCKTLRPFTGEPVPASGGAPFPLTLTLKTPKCSASCSKERRDHSYFLKYFFK